MAAVREDRTPGGKHRSKRVRSDCSELSLPMMTSEPALDALDEKLLVALVDAKPEAIPDLNNVDEGENAPSFATVCLRFYSCRSENKQT